MLLIIYLSESFLV